MSASSNAGDCGALWLLPGSWTTNSKAFELRVGAKVVVSQNEVMTACELVFGFLNPGFEQLGVDRAFVDIEQGHVVIGDLVQLDDELDEVRVGLLPERFLAFAEEIVEQRSDVVCERIGVEVVVQRVVSVLGVQVDLDVVVLASVALEDVFHLVAEVAFHFEHESADALVGVVSPVGDQLLGVWIHAAAGLARADGSEDRNACEESPLGNGQPIGMLGGHRFPGVVHLSEHQEEFVAPARVGIGRQGHRFDLAVGSKGEDVEAGKNERVSDVGSGEQKQGVGVLETQARSAEPESRSDAA